MNLDESPYIIKLARVILYFVLKYHLKTVNNYHCRVTWFSLLANLIIFIFCAFKELNSLYFIFKHLLQLQAAVLKSEHYVAGSTMIIRTLSGVGIWGARKQNGPDQTTTTPMVLQSMVSLFFPDCIVPVPLSDASSR